MKLKALTLVFLLGAGALRAGEGKGSEGKDDGIDAAKLWAQSCMRCHNARPAKSFSDSQWDVIAHHMRVRANLTGPEARAIAQFLKEAN